ncbi:hypothetical protein [Natrinema altunense]|uniref:hypothetical protein n=1 Tax=Natrinema altunense TaxID=222984 RepID=UPI001185A385|nr:hypothetical protein [Natrinema altunense]
MKIDTELIYRLVVVAGMAFALGVLTGDELAWETQAMEEFCKYQNESWKYSTFSYGTDGYLQVTCERPDGVTVFYSQYVEPETPYANTSTGGESR